MSKIDGGTIKKVIVFSADKKQMAFDEHSQSTDVPVFTNDDHWAIHNGRAFESSYVSPHGSEIANDAAITWGISLTAEVHVKLIHGEMGGDAEIELFEGSDFDADGTLMTPTNLDRNSIALSPLTIRVDPTVNNSGIRLYNEFIPGGSGGNSGGGGSEALMERHLNPNHDYIVRLTNRAAAAQMGGLYTWFIIAGE